MALFQFSWSSLVCPWVFKSYHATSYRRPYNRFVCVSVFVGACVRKLMWKSWFQPVNGFNDLSLFPLLRMHRHTATAPIRRACENPKSTRSYLDCVSLNALGLKGLDAIQRELLNAGCHHFLTLPHRSPSNADTRTYLNYSASTTNWWWHQLFFFFSKKRRLVLWETRGQTKYYYNESIGL